MSLQRACPLLAAADPKAAASWYGDQLGFRIALVMDDYAIVDRDGVELHFWRCTDRHIAENTSAYLRVSDVDDLRTELDGLGQGGRISPVADREWGMREFYVWDPDGNLLRIGQPARNATEASPEGSITQSSLLDEIEALSPAELKRQIAEAADAIREGRV